LQVLFFRFTEEAMPSPILDLPQKLVFGLVINLFALNYSHSFNSHSFEQAKSARMLKVRQWLPLDVDYA
jgi:hypothetical protein